MRNNYGAIYFSIASYKVAIAKLEKFDRVPTIISHFGGTNNIFAAYTFKLNENKNISTYS